MLRTTEPEMTWVQWAWERGGWPAVFVAGIAFMTWRVARWISPKADTVIATHLQYVQTATKAQVDQTEQLKQQTQQLQELSSMMKLVLEKLDAYARRS
jgi:hypothetical protein